MSRLETSPEDRAAAVEAATARRERTFRLLQEYGVYAAVALLLVFNVLFTSNFLEPANLRTQLVQVTPVVIVSLGMALVIGTRGIDLSVGSVMALSASVVVLYLGHGPVIAVVVALVTGVLVGSVGGALVAYLGIQPIVATLALLVAVRGLANLFVPQLVEIRNPGLIELGNSALLGVPTIVVIAGALTLVTRFVVRRTTFGRQVVAIGGNRAASELAGLPVRRVLLTVYVVSGLLAAIAGVLATARLQASDPTSLGLFMELSAIAAVVVGGTPLSGGRIRVFGTLMGAMLIQLLSATLIKHNLPQSWTQLVQACIILGAVYLTRERGTR